MKNINITNALLLTALVGSQLQATQLILNGGFEPGLANWIIANQLGSDGSFFLQSGTTSPINGDIVPLPPGGIRAAMTDSQGPGSHVLYQDFFVPSVISVPFSVSFMLYLNNQAGAYSTPNTLDFATPTLNQQFRVDIITTAADPFSVAAADILQNIYQTRIGDPLTSGYAIINSDVTALLQARGGQTLRLRFAEADNVNIFQAGVDQVSISETPEPSTMIAGFAIVGLALIRRKK